MTDTLATLDLTEQLGQRITEYRYRQHHGLEQEVGAEDFALPAHHSHYSYGEVMNDGIGRPYNGAIATWAARLEPDSDKRKAIPLYRGLLRYFPDALAEVARLSQAGNDKHNPGEPLHWSRSKSGDDLDSMLRHTTEAGTLDTDDFYHDVKIAWRALANLQKLLEAKRGLPISPGSRA